MLPTPGASAPFDPLAINLSRYGHYDRTAGVCLLEAVAWFAGEDHTDHPECTCPGLAAYGRTLNDRLLDEERQLLRPLIPRLVGTRATPATAVARCKVLMQDMPDLVNKNCAAAATALRKRGWTDLADRVEGVNCVSAQVEARLVVADREQRAIDSVRRLLVDVYNEIWARDTYPGIDVMCAAVNVAIRAASAIAAAEDAEGAEDADDIVVAAVVVARAAADAHTYAIDVADSTAHAAAMEAEAGASGDTFWYNFWYAQRLAVRRPAVDTTIATFARAINTVCA